jgi:hypothetical protein
MLHINGSTVDDLKSSLDHIDEVINRLRKTQKHKRPFQKMRDKYHLSLPFVMVRDTSPVPLMN